jgi:D-proline dehydrogenase
MPGWIAELLVENDAKVSLNEIRDLLEALDAQAHAKGFEDGRMRAADHEIEAAERDYRLRFEARFLEEYAHGSVQMARETDAVPSLRGRDPYPDSSHGARSGPRRKGRRTSETLVRGGGRANPEGSAGPPNLERAGTPRGLLARRGTSSRSRAASLELLPTGTGEHHGQALRGGGPRPIEAGAQERPAPPRDACGGKGVRGVAPEAVLSDLRSVPQRCPFVILRIRNRSRSIIALVSERFGVRSEEMLHEGRGSGKQMRVAVVGGGIVGLFTAWNLEKEGADVTLFEEGTPGKGSVHAAGIIEPATAYRTNTISFLRRVWRFWKSGTCTIRRVDGSWLVESLRQLERRPLEGMENALRELSVTSVEQYEALAQERNDFDYTELGLIERYDDPRHFAEERTLALSRRSVVPVEVREAEGPAGVLFFPDVSWLHTERFVERLMRELTKTKVIRERVHRVDLDGTVSTIKVSTRFDAVAACTGVSCRKLGVPVTGVRGYGWHARTSTRVDTASIFVDRGIAVVPFVNEVKVTGGWDFDLYSSPLHVPGVLDAARKVVAIDAILDFKEGSRPCTPDGLPTVGMKQRVVAATGGFRLGWSFAPALGRHAALLCLDRARNDPFLARFCSSLHSGRL